MSISGSLPLDAAGAEVDGAGSAILPLLAYTEPHRSQVYLGSATVEGLGFIMETITVDGDDDDGAIHNI